MHTVAKISAAIIGLSGLTTLAQADVGVLDKYECHNHGETNKYHCHGSNQLADLGGLILGGGTRAQGWSTNDDLFVFAGISLNAEYNYRWLAVTTSYSYMPMITGDDATGTDFDDTISQHGWDAGIKAGPGVGRLGLKYYLAAGWSITDITDKGDSSNNGRISGYYAGAGFGWNTRALVLDIMATYRDPSSIEDYLDEKQSISANVTSADVRATLGWRF